jgi:hypothetical protein
MSSVSTQVWTDALDALIDALPRAVTDLQSESAARLLDTAKQLCPVDTGRLRESGHVDESNPLAPEVVFDAPYAFWVHYGSRHHPAQPWLATAADVETPRYLNAVRYLIEDAAARTGARR